jgi:1,4-dihydroxy-2-naphthoate polyprenyltransferase
VNWRFVLGRFRLLFRLARFHFLIFGFLIFLLGYLLAVLNGASFDLLNFLFGYAVFGAAHLSLSFSNDYFDRKSDVFSVHTTFSGGSRVLVEHPNLEPLAFRLAVALLVLSFLGAGFFVFVFGYSLWFFGFVVFGGLLGWFYSAPPLRLAYQKLGEVSTVLAVGLMMPGMGYLVGLGSLDLLFGVFLFPFCCYGLLFILSVEMPDVEADRAAGKVNAVVRWGLRFGLWVSFVSALAGTLWFVGMYFLGVFAGRLDVGLLALFSFVPLVCVASGFGVDLENRACLVRQVAINVSSLGLLLVLFNLYLLVQLLV